MSCHVMSRQANSPSNGKAISTDISSQGGGGGGVGEGAPHSLNINHCLSDFLLIVDL